MDSVTITIEGQTLDICQVQNVGTIISQIARRAKGEPARLCIVLDIQLPGLELKLATPGCNFGGGGGTWTPTPEEQRIYDLWREHVLVDGELKLSELQKLLRSLRERC